MFSTPQYKQLWNGVLYNKDSKELIEFRTELVCRQFGRQRCFITYKHENNLCPRDIDGELMCIDTSVMGGYANISGKISLCDEVEINP